MLGTSVDRSLRVCALSAACIAGFVVLGVGGWAATASLSGAVIAQGNVIVEGFVKKVQHPTGGIIGELLVHDGDQVKAGDVLLNLDETIPRASHAIVAKSIDELVARQARLTAEQNNEPEVRFPEDLFKRSGDTEVDRLMSSETRLFRVRVDARDGQRAQLKERIGQFQEQIQGMREQLRAKEQEIELIGRELVGIRELWRKNLVQIGRVTATERDSARLIGEKGALLGSIAQAKGRITEIELQILQIDQDLRSEAGRDLADIRGKLSELNERRVACARPTEAHNRARTGRRCRPPDERPYGWGCYHIRRDAHVYRTSAADPQDRSAS